MVEYSNRFIYRADIERTLYKMITLLDLPNEILTVIVSYIPINFRMSIIRYVCRRLYHICMLPEVWNKAFIRNVILNETRLAEIVSHGSRQLHIHSSVIAPRNALVNVLRECRDFTSLSLRGVCMFDREIKEPFPTFNTMYYMAYDNMLNFSSLIASEICSCLKNMTVLTHLDLSFNEGSLELDDFPVMKRLKSFAFQTSTDSTLRYLYKFPNLIKLNMSGSEISTLGFMAYMPKLAVLDVSSCCLVPNGLGRICESVPNIAKLNLYDVSDISYMPSLKNLQVLKMGYSNLDILKKFPNLKHLDLLSFKHGFNTLSFMPSDLKTLKSIAFSVGKCFSMDFEFKDLCKRIAPNIGTICVHFVYNNVILPELFPNVQVIEGRHFQIW